MQETFSFSRQNRGLEEDVSESAYIRAMGASPYRLRNRGPHGTYYEQPRSNLFWYKLYAGKSKTCNPIPLSVAVAKRQPIVLSAFGSQERQRKFPPLQFLFTFSSPQNLIHLGSLL